MSYLKYISVFTFLFSPFPAAIFLMFFINDRRPEDLGSFLFCVAAAITSLIGYNRALKTERDARKDNLAVSC